MELIDYVRALRAHWRGVALIIVITVATAMAYTLTQPKVYAADASGFVTAGTSTDPALGQVNDSLAKSRAASYVDIASSRAVADLAISALGLDQSAASLIGQISVEQPVNTVLIKVSARASSPESAQKLADAWVTALSTRVAELENPSDSDQLGVLGVEPVEAAALPQAPVSPRPMRNLMIGALLGALIGLGYAVLRSRLDRRLRSPEDVERRFGVAIVGRLPVATSGLRGYRGGIQVADSVTRDNWGTGEAFRKLRTNLSYMNVDSPPRVVVVTSPRPQDGKSTVAANLAAAIALSGQQVTLLDGDLRRPSVANSLGLVEGAGLTDVLIGTVEIDDVLQGHETLSNLSVLAAGSIPPNPSELLGSLAMQSILKELAVRGMVIVDAPPLLPVTDGAVLTRHSDGAIVVVGYGATLDTELEDSLNQLAKVNGTVLGVVFNRVPNKGTSAESRYYRSTAEIEPDVVPQQGKRRAARR